MTLAALRAEMTRLAKQLPEYDTVRAMYGVGETTATLIPASNSSSGPLGVFCFEGSKNGSTEKTV